MPDWLSRVARPFVSFWCRGRTGTGLDGLRLVVFATEFQLDAARLRLFTARHGEFEYSVAVAGFDALTVGPTGQCHRAAKCSVALLQPGVFAVFDFVLETALATDGEHVIFDLNLDVLRFDTRHRGFQLNRVLGFYDIHRQHPVLATDDIPFTLAPPSSRENRRSISSCRATISRNGFHFTIDMFRHLS
jgi:hypothetical protein